MTVAVVRDPRVRGHGAAMLDVLEEAAGRQGATEALLEVQADNAPALALYERAGWRQLHVRRRYYQPGDVDALILGKTLLTGPAERGTTRHSGTTPEGVRGSER